MKDKQAEQNQEEDEIRLQAIFNASVDGIITINRNGIVESFNPAASKQFGYAEEEVIGNNIKMLMPEPDKSQHDDYIKKYHKSGEKRIIGIGREVIGKRKDGSTFPFKLSVSEVKLEDRIIYTGFIHDISDQKKAEQELLELTEKLENKVKKRTEDLAVAVDEMKHINASLKREVQKRKRAEVKAQKALTKELELGELKSRFVSMASHEFRTPLTGILSSISLIGKYNSPEQEEKKNKHIKRIKTSVQNLTGILNDFLSLDKLQAGKIQCHPQNFDFDLFMEELIEEVGQIKKPEQQIEYKRYGESVQFYTDPQLLKNILLNLVSNAIKYSAEGKCIRITANVDLKSFTVEIRDEGIGIPKQEQEHLFERFFRAKNASNIQGTGLGLNIVAEYINLLNGEINFTSVENQGSTFTISIPVFEPKIKHYE